MRLLSWKFFVACSNSSIVNRVAPCGSVIGGTVNDRGPSPLLNSAIRIKQEIRKSYQDMNCYFCEIFLPTADGSEEPVSEFLFDELLCFNRKNQMKAIAIASTASAPPTPPNMAAIDIR